jgi:pimeloyl-ACP methyl ester carboxylesterase
MVLGQVRRVGAVWLQALGLNGVHLAGSSMGRVIAAQLSLRYSHPVDSRRDTFLSSAKISALALVLWGDSDQVLDVTCADQFCEQIEGAKAMILSAVGHLSMLEEHALSARVLGDFWQARTAVEYEFVAVSSEA